MQKKLYMIHDNCVYYSSTTEKEFETSNTFILILNPLSLSLSYLYICSTRYKRNF